MRLFTGVLLLFLLCCCKEKVHEKNGLAMELTNTQENEWISLMRVEDWRGYNHEGLPSKWSIKDGIISCKGTGGEEGGDIISVLTYDNFELEWEWKISKGGNSGVFYHVVESTKYTFPYETGPEYQLLDDEGVQGTIEDWQKTGANYAMNSPNEKKKLKPVGEWNKSKIVFNEGLVEHWLNGSKILEFDKNSKSWKEKRNSGKWNDFPDYGNTNSGHFALQDHGAGVWFRGIRVKEL